MGQTDIIAVLKKHGEMTQAEIVERTDMSKSSVRNSINRLIRKREIERTPIREGKTGPPFCKYRLKGEQDDTG